MNARLHSSGLFCEGELVLWRLCEPDSPATTGEPSFRLPAGFRIESYRPGDMRDWVAIHREADAGSGPSESLYASQFGADDTVIAKRQFFVRTDTGRAVGTATAWFNSDSTGANWGRVHWVAVLPEFQGRSLSRVLVTEVMNRLRALGHAKVYLTTHESRIPALNLYLRMGFVPWVWDGEGGKVWREIAGRVKSEFKETIIKAIAGGRSSI